LKSLRLLPSARAALSILLWGAATPVFADAEDPSEGREASLALAGGDANFGPNVVVERIEVVGNTATSESVIVRAVPVAVGQTLRVGDPRLADAKYQVLSLGFFRSVEARLKRGSARGRVVLEIRVEERGTLILEQFFLGTTETSPFWAGIDATERNFLGTGFTVGGAVLATTRTRIEGGQPQRSFQLRVSRGGLGNGRFSLFGLGTYMDVSEPYRVRGKFDDGGRENFAALNYKRIGGRFGAAWSLTPWHRLSVVGRAEGVDADRPVVATRTDSLGVATGVELHLRPDFSRVVTGALAYDHDTRSHPILTVSGSRLRLQAEIGSQLLGGSYDYGTLLAKYQHWWPLGSDKHILSLHLTGGLVVGDAPVFERLYVGDLNRLLAPRLLGLIVSTVPPRDYLGLNTDEAPYGEVGGVAQAQYAYRLFRSSGFVYGGDLFWGVGLWTLADSEQLRARDQSLFQALPVGLFVDAGLRIDTELGIFELSLANAIGRLPL